LLKNTDKLNRGEETVVSRELSIATTKERVSKLMGKILKFKESVSDPQTKSMTNNHIIGGIPEVADVAIIQTAECL
jgi:hypothetical protein